MHNRRTGYSVAKLQSYEKWYLGLPNKVQDQIDARLNRIVMQSHFGDSKDLGDSLGELRWKNGLRIYYTIVRERENLVVLILGGNKNGQQKDISKAKTILSRLTSSAGEA